MSYRGKSKILSDLNKFKHAKDCARESISRCLEAIQEYDKEILKLQNELDNYRETLPVERFFHDIYEKNGGFDNGGDDGY